MKKEKRKCGIPECVSKRISNGYCGKHASRLRAHGDPMKTKYCTGEGSTPELRFWSKAKVTANPERCWEWKGKPNGSMGYGIHSYKGKRHCAHRIAWMFANGREAELNVLHKCDNPICVNPHHLEEGTQSDNMKQRYQRGRARVRTCSMLAGVDNGLRVVEKAA